MQDFAAIKDVFEGLYAIQRVPGLVDRVPLLVFT